ncbi:MAG: TetR/AcrR family transcriptional regulator [Proteobacteria bacterium]|nr:TetR/AcrR family transcriptional regulator [Pseudomonadota bacterium]
MGRRSEHSKEELATLIVDQAFNLIEEHGYNQLSTRKIAANIGYTVGMLYNLFTSIDDVIVHVNGRILDMLLQEMSSAAAQHKDPKEKLRAIAWAYYGLSESRFHLWSTLFEYRFPDDMRLPGWYSDKIRIVYEFAGAIIKEASPKEDHITTTALFWSGVHGITSLMSHGKLSRVGFANGGQLMSSFLDKFCSSLKK